MSGALTLTRPARSRFDVNRLVLGTGLALLAGLLAAVALQPHSTWRMPVLVLAGAAIGAVLLRTTFGFAGAFRALIELRDASGFRAHAVMLALATALMMPLLALGQVWGQPMAGGSTAVGVGFAVGALLFGAGMQVGGGCASGTLFSLGGGNARLVGTLAGFVIGSALGAAHMGFWWSLPALPAVTAQGLLGYGPAIALQLAALGLLWGGGAPVQPRPGAQGIRRRATRSVGRGAGADLGRRGAGHAERRGAAAVREAVGRDLGLRTVGIKGGGAARH